MPGLLPLPVYPYSVPAPSPSGWGASVAVAFPFRWTPMFFNLPSSIAASGAAIDAALAATPLHTFELTYNFLRSTFALGEFQTLMGFFLSMRGTVGRFLLSNPDDYIVTGQHIGVGDGSTTVFPIVRTYGTTGGSGTENVGAIDVTGPTITVYLNGTPTSAYTLQTTVPGGQTITFTSAPAGGVVITMDFQFLYYCRFSENNYTFEKQFNQVWSLSKVTLQSCRAGA